MGPDFFAPMAVAIVAIVFGTWAFVSITKLVLSFFRDKNADRSAGSSLTASELSVIVGHAVEDAVRPLEAKIERMERRLAPGREPLDEPLHLSEPESPPVTRRAD